MKKFLTVALAGVLAASMLFTGCSKKAESKVPDKLIVGTNAEFPPFEYMNDKKQPEGFDIAMIKEIGKRMGKKAKVLVKGAKVKRFKKGVDAVMDLKNGSVDAVVIDELTANEFVKKNAKKLKIVIDSAGSEYYCIALTKGNTAYKEEVNKQIKAIKEDGTYDKLKAKYIDSKN